MKTGRRHLAAPKIAFEHKLGPEPVPSLATIQNLPDRPGLIEPLKPLLTLLAGCEREPQSGRELDERLHGWPFCGDGEDVSERGHP